MKKALFVVLAVMLFSLPAHAKVVSRSVEYKQDNTVLQGYLAYDDSKTGKRPGVLVVHEWWGLNDYVRSRVNNLAQLGYVASPSLWTCTARWFISKARSTPSPTLVPTRSA